MDKNFYKYHHVGIIVDQPQKNEEYNEAFGFYASGYFQSEYGIELLRYDPDSPLHPLIKNISHIAFEVTDIDEAIKNRIVISDICEKKEGVKTCFVEVNGAPVEFIQFAANEEKVWPGSKKLPDLKYNHFGIATHKSQAGEIYLKHLKLHCTDHENNPFGLQWMRYDDEAAFPQVVKELPHVAFQVKNLMESIKAKNVIIEPNSPSKGVSVAFIEENGIPIEFLQIDD